MDKKIVPTSARFFLAEDVRTEADGRSTLVAFFPDDFIPLGSPPETPSPQQGVSLFFEGFAILAAFDRAFGTLDVRLKLISPDGRVLIENQAAKLNAVKEGPASFSARFRPFASTAFGKHRYELSVGGAEFAYEFEIRRTPLP